MTTWLKLNFFDGASPVMEQMSYFHDHAMMILVMILTVVGYVLFVLLTLPVTNSNMMEHQILEGVWTVLPAVILIFIALPSLKLLYLTDETGASSISLKVVGHQWYWSYELPDFDKEFDSYMGADLEDSGFRLLDVDNSVVIPMNSSVRVVVTALDVIHSWTVPAAGLSMDAVPGRLNQASMMFKMPGLFFGQCSEICGANHSFMPISVEVGGFKKFVSWVNSV